MNLKFVIVGLLIIAGLFWGTEKYWQHEFQQQARQTLKNIRMDDALRQQISNTGLPIEGDILNQYPNIITYLYLTEFNGKQVPDSIKNNVNLLGCSILEKLKGQEPDLIDAYLTVYKEDKVTSTYIIQNKFKKEIYQTKQMLAECPNFNEVASTKESVIKDAPESMPVSKKTLELNEKLENGG
ncbi:MAG: hypothetical protein RR966_01990 [Acinetobacter sp.]